MEIPEPSVVVLIGPSGAGKSHWAAARFRPDDIVNSDRLRAVVGEGQHDQKASKTAFQLLDLIVKERVRRRLTTVIDTLGLNGEQRAAYLDLAHLSGLPAVAVAFDTPAVLCRERNRTRRDPVPTRVLDGQLRAWRQVRDVLSDEGWDLLVMVSETTPERMVVPASPPKPSETPTADGRLSFALHISSFDGWETEEMGAGLAAIARRAEEVGFSAISVMDHMIQIPQVGRSWDPMLESHTTAAFLAAVTDRSEIGVMVTAASFRNPAHLAKIVATIDVLSGGRAFCGLGTGWFEKEHTAYGWPFRNVAERFDRLEDTLRLLPIMWGPGAKSFQGKTLRVEEAVCYPRPIQERIPIILGGMGEMRTLRLVAQYADACNLFGDAEIVKGKVEVLQRHCAGFDRDFSEITVTHLGPALVGRDRDDVDRL
ncbi:MAG: TIGR03560 family F420-dependent LLM class oxidoreductase, partial [Acidimicrobiia bacterium]|nr:TIGR03560 family F420-dependent LLM class oxidoreductase [Acidimicrobiia bacterium]